MVCDVLVGVCAEQLQEGELHAVRFVCELVAIIHLFSKPHVLTGALVPRAAGHFIWFRYNACLVTFDIAENFNSINTASCVGINPVHAILKVGVGHGKVLARARRRFLLPARVPLALYNFRESRQGLENILVL